MIKTVLFDLDGTLLPMDYEKFMKMYFKGLVKKASIRNYEPNKLIDSVWKGTYAMVKNDGSKLNEEVFWDVFKSIYGEEALKDKDLFDSYYYEEFKECKACCGFEEKVKEILEDLEIVSNLERVKLSKMLKKDYVRGFMVGTFLASGQLSNPSRGSYFLELCFNHEDDANRVLKKLTSYKDEKEMNFKLTKRREKYVVYLKKSDQIPVFLSMMGAISMMLDYENERLTRDFFNNENRLMICSQANYGRTLKTGEKNLEDIKIIEDKIGSVYFEDKVKILVDLRKENKDASYQELADLAISKGVQITKSGVVHIFKKIEKDAEKLK